MVYAASASSIKQALGSERICHHFQISDEADLSHHELIKTLKDKYAEK